MSAATILVGDVRERLRDLEPGSVRCAVTSPPYWGLRDYGTAKWEGGDLECDHIASKKQPTVESSSTLGYPASGGKRRIAEGNTYHEAYTVQFRDICGLCGATRIDSQIGLEQTPEEYVAEMVGVFREVRRVLADDGTLWLNLGDSYSSGFEVGRHDAAEKYVGLADKQRPRAERRVQMRSGLKPKDLVGIPWRVAFALQADGWYLRQDVIWHKPNPMPESVTDRCTKAHEYVFLLSKSPRYYFNADAIAEPSAERPGFPVGGSKYGENVELFHATKSGNEYDQAATRNKRSVWSVTTEPFPGAHFAVMPTQLVEPCILAGSARGDRILDPFAGSGTVGVVALRHGRDFVCVELNPTYAAMAEERIFNDGPLLNEVSVA